MKFLMICVVHICYPENDIHAPSIYAHYIVSCILHDQEIHVHVFGLEYVFEIHLID